MAQNNLILRTPRSFISSAPLVEISSKRELKIPEPYQVGQILEIDVDC